MTKTMLVALLAAGLIAPHAHARVAIFRGRAPVVVPAAPVADRPTGLVAQSFQAMPCEPIPVGSFGEFGQAAGGDIAPVAPMGFQLLDLHGDVEPADARANGIPDPARPAPATPSARP